MKHASGNTLLSIAPLLAELRRIGALRERTPGAFYRGSGAFLHFHEDPAGVFADVKVAETGFTRVPVSTAEQQAELLVLVEEALRSSAGV